MSAVVPTATAPPHSAHVRIEPWPSEVPLFVLNLAAGLAIWLLAVVTIIGGFYALMIGVVLFLVHLGFIAHVRGSGIRVSEAQFPELHAG